MDPLLEVQMENFPAKELDGGVHFEYVFHGAVYFTVNRLTPRNDFMLRLHVIQKQRAMNAHYKHRFWTWRDPGLISGSVTLLLC